MIERKPIKNPDVATVATNGSGPPTFAAVQAEIAAAMAAGELSLPQKFEWFEKKLKAALADSSVSASELAKIARETDVAIEAARQEALAARERGLDFVASPDAKAAREAIENAEFAISRLLTQRPRLEALLDARLLAEQRAAYLVRYEQLKIEGAALAQDLADLYPDAVRRIVEVFAKLAAFQQQCRVLHLSDPGDGRPHVPDPELKARGLHSFSRDQPSLLESVHLHDWQSGREIWPPRPADFAATFAASMIVPSAGPYWADEQVRARIAAEQQQQRERMAAHYASQAAEQLERENRALRENWEASQRRT